MVHCSSEMLRNKSSKLVSDTEVIKLKKETSIKFLNETTNIGIIFQKKGRNRFVFAPTKYSPYKMVKIISN